ncbi:MAG: dihydrolipoyl dehydrogenase [Ferrovum sp. 37-45-19]|uniref:dihydrolipoyl dehydrogenase n=1 Tax=Ferrovum sp. JA12 TaxID=1356299 RepID=UPI000702E384|nr:dihydrolipoyl dehydrogenase [Ferrovum sp. JA12]OYV80288.1 MAG: dihydrolipoyl dehydrogenase [Ferrovum sp. 21-44-67]OYV95034.1 MAG: dihydrolipoyl dehydrogenase [Ferrovum sp. 37-45-19]OZB32210.1 MAG: dihydrolipoyl dehydrogenase [Ferrovum sp. 34-44-207]HQT80910.1 dihydrolipoyl dehydrogenase [Ferrovaceae bacterium]KRH78752.1 dihydrolipoyl dehydrogenase [Ferrovum sp. JA12]
MKNFDLVIIGAGPGGYIAAIRAAQLGMSVACIDKFVNQDNKPSLGGTCLNIGCIPSKALLESSELFAKIQHDFIDHGISVSKPTIDLEKMQSRKQKIVNDLTGGVAYLFKKNKVTSIHGHASFVGENDSGIILAVTHHESTEEICGEKVIVATGSMPRALPHLPFDNISVLDNEGALSLTSVPKRLGIIGSGVIGLEMGSVWKRLGSQVTILEAQSSLLASVDKDIAAEALKIYTKDLDLHFEFSVKLGDISVNAKDITIHYHIDDIPKKIVVDKLIVSIGRVPNTHNLHCEKVGIAVDEKGFIAVDSHCQTANPKIWAIGDVVRGPMLAHKAEEEAVAVVEAINGQSTHVNFNTIPWVIYTSPEIAWVGKTEQQLQTEKTLYRVGKFPFAANGRAKGLNETRGFVKILADHHTDEILGMHIIGPFASELITEAVVAMEFKASSEDIARIVHAHPSLSEVIHEAALAVDGRALNM